MGKFNEHLSNVIISVATVLMSAFVVCILLGVFFRYALNAPLVWSEEAARNLNIWSVFLGAAVAVYKLDHLRVDVLDHFVERWPLALRSILSIVIIFAEGLFAWSLLLGGWYMTKDRWSIPLTTLPVKQGLIYLAEPVSAFLMLWFLFWQVYGFVKSTLQIGR